MSVRVLALLGLLIVLGNGLRSVATSSIFRSEAEFSSFLSITVEATSAVLELLMGAVLVSLLVGPWLMQRLAPYRLALAMTGLAVLAALGLAALFLISPPVDTRIIAVAILFPLMGFALATLAPISQSWARLGGERGSKLLLGLWSMAMPLAFLVTPQLVRVIAPRYGLDTFFAGFAVVTLAIIPLLLVWRSRLIGATGEGHTPIQGKVLIAVLMAVLAFQAVTITITLDGLNSKFVPVLTIAFAATLWFLGRVLRSNPAKESTDQHAARRTMVLLAILFLLNVSTTGFYDTSFLVLHSCSNTLIADRATFAALAQVLAAMLTTAVLARYASFRALIAVGLVCTICGLALYLAYPGAVALAVLPISDPVLFIGSRMITGFGTGLVTTTIIFALTPSGGKSSGVALLLAFVIIIGTEAGLEVFEIASQVWMLTTSATSAPYTGIFLAQVSIVCVASTLLPILSVRAR